MISKYIICRFNIGTIISCIIISLSGCSEEAPNLSPKAPSPNELLCNSVWINARWEELTYYRYADGRSCEQINRYDLIPSNTMLTGNQDGSVETVCNVFVNGEQIDDIVVVKQTNLYLPEDFWKVRLRHLPSQKEITIDDYEEWQSGNTIIKQSLKIDKTTGTAEVVAESEVIQETGSVDIGGYIFPEFTTSEGWIRIAYVGKISDHLPRIPVVYDGDPEIYKSVILRIGYQNNLQYLIYRNPEYDELIKDL